MNDLRRETQKKKAFADFAMRTLIGAIVLLLVAMLSLIILDLSVGAQQRNAIVSCTTPVGKCFKEGEQRTGKAVDAIDKANRARSEVSRQISVYAAYCSRVPQATKSIRSFETCIRRMLKIEGDSFNFTEGDKR